MNGTRGVVSGFAFSAGAVFAAVGVPCVALAQTDEPVAYELLPGSMIIDRCDNCKLVPIVRDLAGTFTATFESSLPGATTYRVTDVALADPAGDYTVSGSGIYRQIVTFPSTQSLELDVAVNEVSGIKLASEAVVVEAPWPAIHIEVTGAGGRDPEHTYTLRLLAEPATEFRRGDTNADEELNIADAVFLLAYLFASSTAPACERTADANDDGAVNIADAVAVLAYLFADAASLPDPFASCGIDSKRDTLTCESFQPCS
jgi:hypothetical protein